MKKGNTMKSRYTFPLAGCLMCLLLAIDLISCKKELKFRDAILVTGTETNNVVSFTVEQPPSQIAVTATSTEVAKQDIVVNFEIDTTLLAGYNHTHKSNFAVPPAGSYTISKNTVTIKGGTNVSDAITVSVTSLANFTDGKPYMIPVTIKSVQGYLGLLESSRTVFLRIARVITSSVIDLANGPYFHTYIDGTNGSTVNNPILNLKAFTWEVRVNIASFPQTGTVRISRLSVFDSDVSFNLLRWGESSDAPEQLQWINSSGAFSSPTHFETNRWYLVSCVYTGTQCIMYIDGKLEGSFTAAGQVYKGTQVEIGYADLPVASNNQRFRGKVSEMRIWNRALSVEEIRNGACAVDPASNGLEAYWKFNEGSGKVFTDYSGHGRILTAPATPAVTWVPNQKCAN